MAPLCSAYRVVTRAGGLGLGAEGLGVGWGIGAAVGAGVGVGAGIGAGGGVGVGVETTGPSGLGVKSESHGLEVEDAPSHAASPRTLRLTDSQFRVLPVVAAIPGTVNDAMAPG